MSTFVRASHVPLFDRLCGHDAGEAQARLQAGTRLRESLRRDLHRLFNTRNGLTRAEFLACEGSVLHYGLPDLLGLCAQSETDLQVIEAVAAHAIGLFEPRLCGVSVKARHDPGHPGRAWIAVSASLVMEDTLQRVDFDIVLDDPGGGVMARA